MHKHENLYLFRSKYLHKSSGRKDIKQVLSQSHLAQNRNSVFTKNMSRKRHIASASIPQETQTQVRKSLLNRIVLMSFVVIVILSLVVFPLITLVNTVLG
jgi:hypothetical protein